MPAPDHHQNRQRPDDAERGDLLDGAEEHPVERAVTTVRHGIDQVADKVKGLLRSDR